SVLDSQGFSWPVDARSRLSGALAPPARGRARFVSSRGSGTVQRVRAGGVPVPTDGIEACHFPPHQVIQTFERDLASPLVVRSCAAAAHSSLPLTGSEFET